MQCQYCKQDIADEAMVCEWCGKRQEPTTTSETIDESQGRFVPGERAARRRLAQQTPLPVRPTHPPTVYPQPNRIWSPLLRLRRVIGRSSAVFLLYLFSGASLGLSMLAWVLMATAHTGSALAAGLVALLDTFVFLCIVSRRSFAWWVATLIDGTMTILPLPLFLVGDLGFLFLQGAIRRDIALIAVHCVTTGLTAMGLMIHSEEAG